METPEHLIEQAFVFRLAAEQSIDPDNELVQDMQLSLIKEEYEELYFDMLEEGYTIEQVREVLAAYEDGYEVIFEEDGATIMEAQEARNNPEKYEAEQKKKTPKGAMPPRGDKRREDFEKWYAANVR